MSIVDLAAVALLVVLAAYGVFGGADFGGGVWDLFAFGPRKQAQRKAIVHAMGPVWEANHVWLIFVVVLFFSCFPGAYATYARALTGPLRLVLIGIVLRGVAFVFRAYGRYAEISTGWSTRLGVLFGVSSAVTPVLLGMCLGAVSTGTLEVTGLLPVAMGLAALSLCAYLAAVFLCIETEGRLREDFRTRALWVGTLVVAGAVTTWPLVKTEAPHLYAGLQTVRAIPLIAAGTICALISGGALWKRKFKLARLAATAQVGLVILGWGAAQYPFLIYPNVQLHQAAAPAATLRFVLWTLPFGLALLLPALVLLYRVFSDARPPQSPH